MSDYVVHLTRDRNFGGVEVSAGSNMMSILASCVLHAGPTPLGSARSIKGIEETQRVECFSEIPLGSLSRLVERRGSSQGFGFSKASILKRGGLPLWYVEKDSPAYQALDRLKKERLPRPDPADPLWVLTPFIDHPGEYGNAKYRFEWEREWRIRGDFPFDLDEVAFLLIEEELHEAARGFFEQVEA